MGWTTPCDCINAKVSGEGDASIGLDPPPSVTDAQGKTTTNIIANLDDVGGGKTGSCTFTTATGSPSVTVTLKGIDVCLTSPQPSTCNPDNLPNYNLTVNLVSATPAGAGGYGSVSSSPSGVSCAMADAATPASCAGSFPQGTQVVLSVTLIPPATGVTWSQACASAGNSLSANVTLNAARTCTATFKP